jgi:hypothetical protein
MAGIGESGDRKVTWIASYPRSGNTWVRFLLANLLSEEPVSGSAVDQLIPDLHRNPCWEQVASNQHIIVKTHLVFASNIPWYDRTGGFIYIVRNPLDVIASNWHYLCMGASGTMRKWPADKLEIFKSAYIDVFIRDKGDSGWFRNGAGTWPANVESWLRGANRFPSLILRYEDLLRDPHCETRRIAAILGLHPSSTDIARAVEASSFDSMRKSEEVEISSQRAGTFYDSKHRAAYGDGLRFVNRGKEGTGLKMLSPAQREAAYRAFGTLMEEVDYPVG